MTDTDTVIAALGREHDLLASLVGTLTAEDLRRPSGAGDWNVSQVLGHLGSAAVINLGTLLGALGEAGEPTEAEVVWARWDAMSPDERAEELLVADAALVDRYQQLTDDERSDLRIELAFLPFPLTAAMAGRMRLNEVLLHGWDVRVAFDAAAALDPDTVPVVLHGEPNLIGWFGKTEVLDGRSLDLSVTTSAPASQFTLRLAERVEVLLDDVSGPSDGTLRLPAEAWLRLVAGRLAAEHTPAGIEVTGAAGLDLLRRVFPATDIAEHRQRSSVRGRGAGQRVDRPGRPPTSLSSQVTSADCQRSRSRSTARAIGSSWAASWACRTASGSGGSRTQRSTRRAAVRPPAAAPDVRRVNGSACRS